LGLGIYIIFSANYLMGEGMLANGTIQTFQNSCFSLLEQRGCLVNGFMVDCTASPVSVSSNRSSSYLELLLNFNLMWFLY